MVCRLSQLSEYSFLGSKWIPSKNLLHYIIFLAADEKTNNSALIFRIIIIQLFEGFLVD